MSAENSESSNDGTLKFGGKYSGFQDGASHLVHEVNTDVSQGNVFKPRYQREKSFVKTAKVKTRLENR